MFACTMYPGTSKFQNLVKQEVRQNVQRLRNHASIGIWCGNNENETGWLKRWMMGGIPYGKADSAKLYQDHKVLFHNIIPEIVKQEDPSRFYTRSSPSANDDEIRPDKIGFGDIHDWHVWFGTGDYRKYKNNVSRFQSEYGYQSFPAMESIKKFSESQDWYEDSDVMDVHQKHPNGNSKIKKFSAQFYQKPKDFESFTYVSQLQQAEAMKFAIETHRTKMPYCMGSLYWQLNDCWPAASWSSIDYYGTWKATQYFAKKANEPLALFSKLAGDSIKISIVNEALKPFAFQGFEIVWKDFFGKELSRQEILIPKGNVADNMVWNKTFALKKAKWSPTDSASIFIQIKAISKSGTQSISDVQYLKLPKDLKLVETELNPVLEKTSSGYTLKLKPNLLVKNLSVSSKNGNIHFSDNYVDLLPGEEKSIEFDSKEPVSIADLQFKMLVNE
jgi:beta-mannosidase